MIGFQKFGKTGVKLAQGEKKVKFVHRLEEPILIEGIISYLQSEKEYNSPFQRLYDYVSKQVVAITHSTVRGTYLDALVFCVFLLKVAMKICVWASFFNMIFLIRTPIFVLSALLVELEC